ncbi:branched-chain-amino-acid aminotransferase-like protein 2 isoform X2 [Selaginella moellendorffii]|nr:branched-chain-amino-acid aminotransferase-like protein 2 isoform X1 [Selaginella moellendorffii]XP_024528257.1 branched-chain-amino-acid aminotransferase-like protein 2 isoform X2 [Selaginella moellendorffii]|eukprot:XP_002967648.2 branched-chain-amino-acid aminotransferase-like protein 2 isoform X1 [Selaginella moellendorffii]
MEGNGGEMNAKPVEVIQLWTGPRSLSTSLMYSFAQRDDTEVLDEPLYAHYLRVSGAERPYRDELLTEMESDGSKVVEAIFGPCKMKYRFCKQMAKFRTPCLTDDILKGKHVILIRDPLAILPSFDDVVPATLKDLQWSSLLSMYSDLQSIGESPPVIDASDLQKDPEGVLRALCAALGMDFQHAMLKWNAGPKPEDGMWAKWWYSSVHRSTEFSPLPLHPRKPFPKALYTLLEECRPIYKMLKRHALQPQAPEAPPLPVPSNKNIFAWVGDEIVPRDDAKVSVFDSIVQGGDGVWEGLRIYKGKVFKLGEHLDRLFDSAKAMAFTNLPSRDFVKRALFSTLIINGMFDNAHVRLTLTRGMKVTSGMSPAFNLYGCTLLVVAEWKPPVYDNSGGIRLITASTRRNSPNCLDSKIHHNNLINNILAKVEGNTAGVDDAIMLDCDGFVSETNATNIFMVKKGRVLTPSVDYCLPGITRETVIELVKQEKIAMIERRISLTEFHTADEVWTTGTMGEITPVIEIDGRQIGSSRRITSRIQAAYKALTDKEGEPIPCK